MARSDMRLRVQQVGLEQSMEEGYNRGARRISRRPVRLSLDSKSFEQPLGRITGRVGEFQKSMDASVARVMAFGAAVGVINGVQKAFGSLVKESIAVEKALTDINVLLQLSSNNLTRFGSELFAVARNTAQGFNEIATAATEFARQGLTAEETLKRVNDAMVLTRLSGLAAANSVNVLTAAVNSFTNEALKTTDVVNRLANVDAAFAVSSKDLADSMARAGAAAMSAGVQFNELLAITTAVQQRTARGGAVIGNAFKTIFTRLQRSSVREVMEGIGIATTKMDGSFRSSADVLRDYARVYQTLTDAQRAYTSEQVAGVRQVNILKSLIGDMGNKYSIFNRALGTANNTTDEAIRRNAELNKTMAALSQQTALSVQQLAASLGKLTMNEGVQRILGIIKTLSDGLNKLLNPESGSGLMQGFFRGIGAFIAGPGLVLIGGAFLKIFKIVGKLGLDAGRTLFGLNQEAERQKNLQMAITSVLQKEEQIMQRLLAAAGNQAKQERIILDIIRQETAERAKQQRFVAGLARLPGLRGINAGDQGFAATTPAAAARIAPRAAGHIPQQSVASITERARAAEGGYKAGRTVAMNLPSSGKPIVYNMAESVKYLPGFKDPFINPPKGKGTAWKKHQQRSIDTVGIDPYAGGGFVPNLSGRWSTGDAEAALRRWIQTFKKHHGAFVGGGADSIRDLMRHDPNFTQTDRVKANDIYTYLKTRPDTPGQNARRLAFLMGHQGTGAQSSKYKHPDPGWGQDPKTVKLINEFVQTYDIAAEPGREKKEEMIARMSARENAPLPRPGLKIKVGKKPSLFATMGASPFKNEITMNALQKTRALAADVLEARWGNTGERMQMGGVPEDSALIHPKTKIKLTPRVDVARTQVSKAEFDEEIKKVLPRDPKTGRALPLNKAALGQLGAKLFPITPGRIDSIAQQDFSKRASQVITSHANKKHIWQKEHSQKTKGGMLNRKVGPGGRAPSFSESEKFLKKKGDILFGKDKTPREKGQARGWIFDQLSHFAMGALTGAGRTEVMAMDKGTWDMPSKLHERYQDYYNTTAQFGDYKAGVKAASASFIGKHIRRPLGAHGFIPSLAPAALKYRELERYASDGRPGLTSKISKSVREGAITESQGAAILAKTATAKGETRKSERDREEAIKKRREAKPRVDAKGLVTMLVPQKLGLTPGGAETAGHRIEFMMAGIEQAKPPNIKNATDLRLRRLSGAIASSAFPPARSSTPSTLTGDPSAAAGIVWETAAKHAAKVGISASDNKRFDIGRAGDPLAAAPPNQALRTMFHDFSTGWADMKLNTGLQGEMAQKVYGAYEAGQGPFKGLKKRKKKAGAAGGFIPKMLSHQAAGSMPDFHAEGFIPNFFPAMRVPTFLEEMALKIKKAGGSAQVVGGAPRDHVLGITPKDWDVEVFGLTQDRLQKLLKSEGGLSKDGLIGKDFGVFKTKHKGEEYEFTLPRRERKTGAGHKDFDVEVDPGMSRKEAAQRRDLTLNSIGFDPLTKKFIDPLGGLKDLQAGVMRPTSPRFKEDPLRVLRSMQFAGRYGFSADKKLLQYSRGMIDEFGALPKERVRDEWHKWATKSKHPGKGLQFLEDSGWIKHFPEIQNLRGIPQNPKFHPEGDVFEHVKLVTDAMAANPKWQNLDEGARSRLMYSALSHDFGKVTHTQITEAGITSRGHAEAGVPLMESFLERIMSKGEAAKLSARIGPYVKDHMFHAGFPQNITDKSVRRLSSRVQDMEEFMILEEADMMGRGMRDHHRPWQKDFDKVDAIIKKQGIAKAPPRSLVLGRHLIAGDLATPGPQMGRILKELHTAQLDGKFHSLEGGLEYFKNNRQRMMAGTAASGFIPHLARPQSLYRGQAFQTRDLIRSPDGSRVDYLRGLDAPDIPPWALRDPALAARSPSEFIESVEKFLHRHTGGMLSGSYLKESSIGESSRLITKRNLSREDMDEWNKLNEPLGSGAVSFTPLEAVAKKFAHRGVGSTFADHIPTVPSDFNPNYSSNTELMKAFEKARGAVFEVKGFNADKAWSIKSLEEFFRTGDPSLLGLKRGGGLGPALNFKPYTERFSRPLEDLQTLIRKGHLDDPYIDAYKGFNIGLPREEELTRINFGIPGWAKQKGDQFGNMSPWERTPTWQEQVATGVYTPIDRRTGGLNLPKAGRAAGMIPSLAGKIIPFPQQSSQWISKNVPGMKTGGIGLEKAYLEYYLNAGGKIPSGDLGRLMKYGYSKKDLNKMLEGFKADGGVIHGAEGFVPNFSGISIQAQKGMPGLIGEKVRDAWNAEHAAGVPWGDIRLGTHPSIPSPGHLAVYDVKQGGLGGALGDHGGAQGAMRDSLAARSQASGFIPSFADNPWGLQPRGTVRDPDTNKVIKHTAAIEQGTRAINTQLSLYRQGTISLDQFHSNVRQLTTDFKITSSSLSNVQRALAGQISSIDRERAAAAARGAAMGGEVDEAKKAMRAQQMMMAAFVLPMATGFLPQPGGRGGAGDMGLGALHGAGQAGGIGAMLAMSGSTPGMVAGGVVTVMGGVIGMLKAMEKSLEALGKELQKVNDYQMKLQNSVKAYVSVQEQLNKAYSSGDVKAQERNFKELTKAFRGIEDAGVRSEIIGASADLDKLAEVLERVQDNAEGTIRSNSALMKFKEADTARETIGIENVGQKAQSWLPWMNFKNISDTEGSAEWNKQLQAVGVDIGTIKDLTQKEIEAIRGLDLETSGGLVKAFQQLGMDFRTAMKFVSEIDAASGGGRGGDNLKNILFRALSIQEQRARDLTGLQAQQQLAQPGMALKTDLFTAFEELAKVSEKVIKNFDALSKMEKGVLETSQQMATAFGAGDTRSSQRKQVIDFQKEAVSAKGIEKIEGALRQAAADMLEAENVAPATLGSLEKLLVNIGNKIGRGGSFGDQQFGGEIMKSIESLRGVLPTEVFNSIDETLKDIQMETQLQNAILNSQLKTMMQGTAAAQSQAMQAKFSENFLRDLRFSDGFKTMGGIDSVTSMKDEADVFLRMKDELEKRGVELDKGKIAAAEDKRLVGNLADFMHGLEILTTDTKGAGLNIPGFDPSKAGFQDLFKTDQLFQGLGQLSDLDFAKEMDFDKFIGPDRSADVETAEKEFLGMLDNLSLQSKRKRKLNTDERDYFKGFFQAAMLREREKRIGGREGGADTLKAWDIAQAADKAVVSKDPLDGPSTQYRDRAFDKEGNLVEGVAMSIAREMAKGPQVIALGQIGGKIERSNTLLEQIETSLQHIAGTFETRQSLKERAEERSENLRGVGEAAGDIIKEREQKIAALREDYVKTVEGGGEPGSKTLSVITKGEVAGTDAVRKDELTARLSSILGLKGMEKTKGGSAKKEARAALEGLVDSLREPINNLRSVFLESDKKIPMTFGEATSGNLESVEVQNTAREAFADFKKKLKAIDPQATGLQMTLDQFYERIFLPLSLSPDTTADRLGGVGGWDRQIGTDPASKAYQEYATKVEKAFSDSATNLSKEGTRLGVDTKSLLPGPNLKVTTIAGGQKRIGRVGSQAGGSDNELRIEEGLRAAQAQLMRMGKASDMLYVLGGALDNTLDKFDIEKNSDQGTALEKWMREGGDMPSGLDEDLALDLSVLKNFQETIQGLVKRVSSGETGGDLDDEISNLINKLVILTNRQATPQQGRNLAGQFTTQEQIAHAVDSLTRAGKGLQKDNTEAAEALKQAAEALTASAGDLEQAASGDSALAAFADALKGNAQMWEAMKKMAEDGAEAANTLERTVKDRIDKDPMLQSAIRELIKFLKTGSSGPAAGFIPNFALDVRGAADSYKREVTALAAGGIPVSAAKAAVRMDSNPQLQNPANPFGVGFYNDFQESGLSDGIQKARGRGFDPSRYAGGTSARGFIPNFESGPEVDRVGADRSDKHSLRWQGQTLYFKDEKSKDEWIKAQRSLGGPVAAAPPPPRGPRPDIKSDGVKIAGATAGQAQKGRQLFEIWRSSLRQGGLGNTLKGIDVQKWKAEDLPGPYLRYFNSKEKEIIAGSPFRIQDTDVYNRVPNAPITKLEDEAGYPGHGVNYQDKTAGIIRNITTRDRYGKEKARTLTDGGRNTYLNKTVGEASKNKENYNLYLTNKRIRQAFGQYPPPPAAAGDPKYNDYQAKVIKEIIASRLGEDPNLEQIKQRGWLAEGAFRGKTRKIPGGEEIVRPYGSARKTPLGQDAEIEKQLKTTHPELYFEQPVLNQITGDTDFEEKFPHGRTGLRQLLDKEVQGAREGRAPDLPRVFARGFVPNFANRLTAQSMMPNFAPIPAWHDTEGGGQEIINVKPKDLEKYAPEVLMEHHGAKNVGIQGYSGSITDHSGVRAWQVGSLGLYDAAGEPDLAATRRFSEDARRAGGWRSVEGLPRGDERVQVQSLRDQKTVDALRKEKLALLEDPRWATRRASQKIFGHAQGPPLTEPPPLPGGQVSSTMDSPGYATDAKRAEFEALRKTYVLERTDKLESLRKQIDRADGNRQWSELTDPQKIDYATQAGLFDVEARKKLFPMPDSVSSLEAGGAAPLTKEEVLRTGEYAGLRKTAAPATHFEFKSIMSPMSYQYLHPKMREKFFNVLNKKFGTDIRTFSADWNGFGGGGNGMPTVGNILGFDPQLKEEFEPRLRWARENLHGSGTTANEDAVAKVRGEVLAAFQSKMANWGFTPPAALGTRLQGSTAPPPDSIETRFRGVRPKRQFKHTRGPKITELSLNSPKVSEREFFQMQADLGGSRAERDLRFRINQSEPGSEERRKLIEEAQRAAAEMPDLNRVIEAATTPRDVPTRVTSTKTPKIRRKAGGFIPNFGKGSREQDIAQLRKNAIIGRKYRAEKLAASRGEQRARKIKTYSPQWQNLQKLMPDLVPEHAKGKNFDQLFETDEGKSIAQYFMQHIEKGSFSRRWQELQAAKAAREAPAPDPTLPKLDDAFFKEQREATRRRLGLPDEAFPMDDEGKVLSPGERREDLLKPENVDALIEALRVDMNLGPAMDSKNKAAGLIPNFANKVGGRRGDARAHGMIPNFLPPGFEVKTTESRSQIHGPNGPPDITAQLHRNGLPIPGAVMSWTQLTRTPGEYEAMSRLPHYVNELGQVSDVEAPGFTKVRGMGIASEMNTIGEASLPRGSSVTAKGLVPQEMKILSNPDQVRGLSSMADAIAYTFPQLAYKEGRYNKIKGRFIARLPHTGRTDPVVVDLAKIPEGTPLIGGIAEELKAQGVSLEDFKGAMTGEEGTGENRFKKGQLDIHSVSQTTRAGGKRDFLQRTPLEFRAAKELSDVEYKSLSNAVAEFNIAGAAQGGEVSLAPRGNPNILELPDGGEARAKAQSDALLFLSSPEYKGVDGVSPEARAKIANSMGGTLGSDLLQQGALGPGAVGHDVAGERPLADVDVLLGEGGLNAGEQRSMGTGTTSQTDPVGFHHRRLRKQAGQLSELANKFSNREILALLQTPPNSPERTDLLGDLERRYTSLVIAPDDAVRAATTVADPSKLPLHLRGRAPKIRRAGGFIPNFANQLSAQNKIPNFQAPQTKWEDIEPGLIDKIKAKYSITTEGLPDEMEFNGETVYPDQELALMSGIHYRNAGAFVPELVTGPATLEAINNREAASAMMSEEDMRAGNLFQKLCAQFRSGALSETEFRREATRIFKSAPTMDPRTKQAYIENCVTMSKKANEHRSRFPWVESSALILGVGGSMYFRRQTDKKTKLLLGSEGSDKALNEVLQQFIMGDNGAGLIDEISDHKIKGMFPDGVNTAAPGEAVNTSKNVTDLRTHLEKMRASDPQKVAEFMLTRRKSNWWRKMRSASTAGLWPRTPPVGVRGLQEKILSGDGLTPPRGRDFETIRNDLGDSINKAHGAARGKVPKVLYSQVGQSIPFAGEVDPKVHAIIERMFDAAGPLQQRTAMEGILDQSRFRNGDWSLSALQQRGTERGMLEELARQLGRSTNSLNSLIPRAAAGSMGAQDVKRGDLTRATLDELERVRALPTPEPNTFPRRTKVPSPRARGFIPNFVQMSPAAKQVLSANPEAMGITMDSVQREASFGVTPKVTQIPGLGSPFDLAVINTQEGTALGAKAAHGGQLSPLQSSSRAAGFIPNFATKTTGRARFSQSAASVPNFAPPPEPSNRDFDIGTIEGASGEAGASYNYYVKHGIYPDQWASKYGGKKGDSSARELPSSPTSGQSWSLPLRPQTYKPPSITKTTGHVPKTVAEMKKEDYDNQTAKIKKGFTTKRPSQAEFAAELRRQQNKKNLEENFEKLDTVLTSPFRLMTDVVGSGSGVVGWVAEGGPAGVAARLMAGEENWWSGDGNFFYDIKDHAFGASDWLAHTGTNPWSEGLADNDDFGRWLAKNPGEAPPEHLFHARLWSDIIAGLLTGGSTLTSQAKNAKHLRFTDEVAKLSNEATSAGTKITGARPSLQSVVGKGKQGLETTQNALKTVQEKALTIQQMLAVRGGTAANKVTTSALKSLQAAQGPTYKLLSQAGGELLKRAKGYGHLMADVGSVGLHSALGRSAFYPFLKKLVGNGTNAINTPGGWKTFRKSLPSALIGGSMDIGGAALLVQGRAEQQGVKMGFGDAMGVLTDPANLDKTSKLLFGEGLMDGLDYMVGSYNEKDGLTSGPGMFVGDMATLITEVSQYGYKKLTGTESSSGEDWVKSASLPAASSNPFDDRIASSQLIKMMYGEGAGRDAFAVEYLDGLKDSKGEKKYPNMMEKFLAFSNDVHTKTDSQLKELPKDSAARKAMENVIVAESAAGMSRFAVHMAERLGGGAVTPLELLNYEEWLNTDYTELRQGMGGRQIVGAGDPDQAGFPAGPYEAMLTPEQKKAWREKAAQGGSYRQIKTGHKTFHTKEDFLRHEYNRYTSNTKYYDSMAQTLTQQLLFPEPEVGFISQAEIDAAGNDPQELLARQKKLMSDPTVRQTFLKDKEGKNAGISFRKNPTKTPLYHAAQIAVSHGGDLRKFLGTVGEVEMTQGAQEQALQASVQQDSKAKDLWQSLTARAGSNGKIPLEVNGRAIEVTPIDLLDLFIDFHKKESTRQAEVGGLVDVARKDAAALREQGGGRAPPPAFAGNPLAQGFIPNFARRASAARGIIPNFQGVGSTAAQVSHVDKVAEALTANQAGYPMHVKPSDAHGFKQPDGTVQVINRFEDSFRVKKNDTGEVSDLFAHRPGGGPAKTAFNQEMSARNLSAAPSAAGGFIPNFAPTASLPAVDTRAMEESASTMNKAATTLSDAAEIFRSGAIETKHGFSVAFNGLDAGALAETLKVELADKIKEVIQAYLGREVSDLNPFKNTPPGNLLS